MKRLVYLLAVLSLSLSAFGQRSLFESSWQSPQVATPTFDHETGSYATSVTVTPSSTTTGAAFLKCTQVSSDCTPGTTYTAPEVITVTNTHYCVIATYPGMTNSATHCATYTISGGAGTFTKRQNTFSNSSCTPTSTTCNVTITATTEHSKGILFYEQQYTSTGTLTGVSGGGGSWVVDTGCAYDWPAATSYIVCAYNLDMATSTTTLTLTLSGAPGAGSSQNVAFFEYGYSGSSVSKDTSGVRQQASQVSPIPGVTLTLSGSTDVIVQCAGYSSNITAIQAPYGNYTGGGGSQLTCGDIENTASGTAPNFTVSAIDYGNLAAIALKGN